ncbi:MAG: hypothetical protein GY926_19575 [bacterium]|nr:hypothetical protein [bacterium]
MTRLDRALHAWPGVDEGPSPAYVHGPLFRAGMLEFDDYDETWDLNEKGRDAMEALGYRDDGWGGWRQLQEGDDE